VSTATAFALLSAKIGAANPPFHPASIKAATAPAAKIDIKDVCARMPPSLTVAVW
jgi:hypothetical protein